MEGRFQSFNVCLDVWSNRGVSEAPKIAETCGADEIRIDASTAAAVMIRASLFMILTQGVYLSRGLPFFLCGSRCNPDDLHPTTTGYYGLSRRVQGALFLFPLSTGLASSKANVEGLAALAGHQPAIKERRWARRSSLKDRLARGDGMRSSEAMHGSRCIHVGTMD